MSSTIMYTEPVNIVINPTTEEQQNVKDLFDHNLVSAIKNDVSFYEASGNDCIKIVSTGYNKKVFEGNEKLLVTQDLINNSQLYGIEVSDIKIVDDSLVSGDVISAQNDKTYTIDRKNGSVDIILTNEDSVYNITHKDTKINIQKDKYSIDVKGLLLEITDSKITLKTAQSSGAKIELNKTSGKIEASNALTGQFEILTLLGQILTSYLVPLAPPSAGDVSNFIAEFTKLFNPKT